MNGWSYFCENGTHKPRAGSFERAWGDEHIYSSFLDRVQIFLLHDIFLCSSFIFDDSIAAENLNLKKFTELYLASAAACWRSNFMRSPWTLRYVKYLKWNEQITSDIFLNKGNRYPPALQTQCVLLTCRVCMHCSTTPVTRGPISKNQKSQLFGCYDHVICTMCRLQPTKPVKMGTNTHHDWCISSSIISGLPIEFCTFRLHTSKFNRMMKGCKYSH